MVLDVGETLVREGRMWAAWAEVCGVDAFTFTAVLGAAIAAGDHRRVFSRLGVDPVPLRPRFSALFGGYRGGDLYPDAVEAVRALRRAGYRVGVAGNQRAWAAGGLRAAGVAADAYGSSEEWGVRKPDARFFVCCCEMVGAKPRDVAYVGDDPAWDVAAAQAAGLRAVWLRRGPWAALGDQAAGARADAVVTALAQVPAALAEMG